VLRPGLKPGFAVFEESMHLPTELYSLSIKETRTVTNIVLKYSFSVRTAYLLAAYYFA
jgi:hypothetical protein